MARKVVESRSEWFTDLLYGDYDGGQAVGTTYGSGPQCVSFGIYNGLLIVGPRDLLRT